MLFTSGQLGRMELTLTTQPSRICLIEASNSSCANSCFANAGTYQNNVFPAVCYREKTDTLAFSGTNTQTEYDFLLLIVDNENNQQIVDFTADLLIDFNEIPEGFYSIHGFSFKKNQGIEALLQNESHTINSLQETLSLQNLCFDLILDNAPIIQHSALLEISVSLECEEDVFSLRTGKALVQIESMGGSGRFDFIGAQDGDLLAHQTQSFVRIQDSAGCFVQKFIEVNCPPQASQTLGFVFLDQQATVTARQPNYFVQFYSPTNLKITAQVYNAAGQKIIENNHPTKVGINGLNFSTVNWAPGIYILALDNFNQRIQMRFLVY